MRSAAAGVSTCSKCWVAVFAAHGPTSIILFHAQGCACRFVQMRARLPGIAVNCALARRQVTAAIFGTTSMAWLRAAIMLGYRGWGARRGALVTAAARVDARPAQTSGPMENASTEYPAA